MPVFHISPSEYVRWYRGLYVTAVGPTGTLKSESCAITGYKIIQDVERDKLLRALQKVLGLKVLPPIYTTSEAFTFPDGDVMNTREPFYWQGIRRAFHFKASPAEMQDVLRLAYRCGRIGTGKDVAGQPAAALTMGLYARQNFGQDCNALVGNYFNLSPELYIGSYVYSSDTQEADVVKKTTAKPGWNGWGRAEVLSLPYVPLTPRQSASEAEDGDVLVDVENGKDYAHIAIVQDVIAHDKENVSWRVVEWGQSTAESSFDSDSDKHIKPITKVKLTKGPWKNLGVGHPSMNGTRFRYLFAGPDVPHGPGTIGRCGVDGV